MRSKLFYWVLAMNLLLVGACSRSDRQEMHDKAANLAHEAKQQAHDVASEIKTNDTGEAQEKLHHGEQDLKRAGAEATVKLDRAALEAKVKARLASDLGASSLTNISVTSSNAEVTLSGRVSSEARRKAAETSAAAVPGVAQVHNELTVEP